MKSLEQILIEYGHSDYYGFHMPGHKRNSQRFGRNIPYGMDITEIEGFDDLHHAEGILLEAQKEAAEVFKAEESFYLINGSTAGNLAAIMTVSELGDKILIARNNHKSIYNGVFLNHLKPEYIYPKFDNENKISGQVNKKEIKKLLEKENDICAVVVVSPTYDGVVSDVQGIAEIAHGFGVPLIVDEAHGAHFSMHDYFPKNSNELGADIVIQSVHKTLPALTQAALIHVNGNLVDRGKLRRYLKIFQSSSPSYVLMSSINSCVNMLRDEGAAFFDEYVRDLDELRQRLKNMRSLKLVETEYYDKSKIVILVGEWKKSKENSELFTSKNLYNILLEKYHLQMEMCGANYVTAMTSVGDTKEGFLRLVEALEEIDGELTGHYEKYNKYDSEESFELPRIRQATEGEVVSDGFYYIYPPGIPLVTPGEVLSEEVNYMMSEWEARGFQIHKS